MRFFIKQKLIFYVCSVCILTIGYIHYSRSANNEPIFVDEIVYVSQAAIVTPKAITDWNEIFPNIQPFFYAYVWGTVLFFQGHTNIYDYLKTAKLIPPLSFRYYIDCANNKTAYPDCNDILIPVWELRKFTPTIAVSILLIAWIISYHVSGFFGGAATVIAVGIQPLVTKIAVRTTSDGLLILTMLLVLYFSIRLVESLEEDNIFKSSLFLSLTGIVAGLSLSTKLNGILTSIYTVILLLVLKGYSVRFKIFLIGVFLFITISTYTQLHWWIPRADVYTLAHERITIIHDQRLDFPQYALLSFTQKIQAIYSIIFENKFQYLFPLPASFSGISFLLLPFSFFGFSISYSKKRALILLLIWSTIVITVTTFALPLDWDRYYLPITVATSLLFGIGTGLCIQRLFNYMSYRLIPLDNV